MALTALPSRELYRSPNGDRWLLAREPSSGRAFIRHEANLPSGGQVSEIEIGEFLRADEYGPEQQALMRLIGTLIDEEPAAGGSE
jgi:hypothetical protein